MNVYKPLIIFNNHPLSPSWRTDVRTSAGFSSKARNQSKKIMSTSNVRYAGHRTVAVIGYERLSKIAHYALDNDLTLKQALNLGLVTEACSTASSIRPKMVHRRRKGQLAAITRLKKQLFQEKKGHIHMTNPSSMESNYFRIRPEQINRLY